MAGEVTPSGPLTSDSPLLAGQATPSVGCSSTSRKLPCTHVLGNAASFTLLVCSPLFVSAYRSMLLVCATSAQTGASTSGGHPAAAPSHAPPATAGRSSSHSQVRGKLLSWVSDCCSRRVHSIRLSEQQDPPPSAADTRHMTMD